MPPTPEAPPELRAAEVPPEEAGPSPPIAEAEAEGEGGPTLEEHMTAESEAAVDQVLRAFRERPADQESLAAAPEEARPAAEEESREGESDEGEDSRPAGG